MKIKKHRKDGASLSASQSVKGRPEEREFLLSWTNVVDYE